MRWDGRSLRARNAAEHAPQFFAAVVSLPATTHVAVARLPRAARVPRGLRATFRVRDPAGRAASLFHDPPPPRRAAPRVVLCLWTVLRLLATIDPPRSRHSYLRRDTRPVAV